MDILTCPSSRGAVVAAVTTAGTRPLNEDMVFAEPSRGVYAVADGLGGPERGDAACRILHACLSRPELGAEEALNEANRLIRESAQAAGKVMGATIAVAAVNGRTVDLYHAGEVRAYHVRGGEARLLTEDHTLAMQLVKLKQLAPEAAASHPGRKTPLRYVGKDVALKLDHQRLELAPGDSLVLSSDGVHAALGPEALAGLEGGGSSAALAQRLCAAIEAAVAAGSDDNASVLCLSVPMPASPAIETSAGLRELVAAVLASPAPADEVRAFAEGVVDALGRAAGATQVLLARREAHGLVAVAGQAALLARGQRVALEALERGSSAREGTLTALPVPAAGTLVVCMEGAADPDEAALAPAMELAAWEPVLRALAARLGPH